MIDVATMRAAGMTDSQIVQLLELDQKERKAKRREQNRIAQQNHRSRKQKPADSQQSHADSADKPHGRASRLDPAWTPSREGTDFAIFELGGEHPAFRELERFRDYWLARAGAGARKISWEATWRNWVRTAQDRGQRNGTNGPRPPQLPAGDRARILADEIREREREAGIDRPPNSQRSG